MLLTQVQSPPSADDDTETALATYIQPQSTYPLQPPVDSVAEFKTTPMIHAGYAATWFGLSGAGLYMTRMLITRGRG